MNKIIIALIFLITAVTIVGIALMLSNWASNDICEHKTDPYQCVWSGV